MRPYFAKMDDLGKPLRPAQRERMQSNIAAIEEVMKAVEAEEERIKNVAGAFALRRPDEMKDRDVLLIDDVFTTGATMNECARVLKDAGAARVTALTLARAV